MKYFIPSVVLAGAFVFAAQAADQPSVQSGTYAVEPFHTRLLFSVNHFGFNDYFGEFTGVAGVLKLDPKNLNASQLDITVPVENITTTNAKLDGELRGADWFDAAQFPAMHFVSTKITQTGPNTAEIAGTLTLHGVSKPLILDATLTGAGVNPLDKTFTVGFRGQGHLKRSDFGVGQYVPLVSDDVNLIISAAFEKTADRRVER